MDQSLTKTTLTALYGTYGNAESTVRDLEAAGISHNDISIVANKETHAGAGAGVGAGAGAVVGGGVGLLAGLGMLAIPGVGPVVAAGWLIATAAGAAVGAGAGAATGGIIGAMTESGVSKDHAHVYAEGVRRGGALVSVKALVDMTGVVRAILDRHHPINPDTRGAAYRKAGWTTFDEKAPPYTAAELTRETTLY
jgi:hypothetical protein